MKTKTSNHKKTHLHSLYGKALRTFENSLPVNKANEKVTPKSYSSSFYIRPSGNVEHAWRMVGNELEKAIREWEQDIIMNNNIGITVTVTGVKSDERR